MQEIGRRNIEETFEGNTEDEARTRAEAWLIQNDLVKTSLFVMLIQEGETGPSPDGIGNWIATVSGEAKP